jgi:sulfide dehydrogenase cytochrome subunit
MRCSVTLPVLVGAVGLAAAAHASGGPDAQAIAFTCNTCHGYDGVSQGATPSLRGLPPSYFTQAMRDFREGRRTATIMDRLARAYSDEEVAAVAAYYAAMR